MTNAQLIKWLDQKGIQISATLQAIARRLEESSEAGCIRKAWIPLVVQMEIEKLAEQLTVMRQQDTGGAT